MNLKGYTDAELAALKQQVVTEQDRRYRIHHTEQQIDDLAAQYQDAIGRQDGEPWEQPSHALDAYSRGAIVTHNGKHWQSTTPVNVWPPGQSGWRELPTQDEETGEETVPEYQQPTGGHDAYQTGEQVTWQGEVYESVIDENVWTPADYPQGWKRIED